MVAGYTHARPLEDAYLELARAWQQEGNSEQVIATCTQLLELNPNHPEAHLIAGIEYYKQGSTQSALKHFNARISALPFCAITHLYAGMAHAVENNFDAAITHYVRSLSYNSDNVKTYAVYGVALEKKGALEEAISAYKQGLLRDAKNPELRIRLAQALKTSRQFENALIIIEDLVQDFPAHTSLLEDQAEILVQLNRYDEALSLYTSFAQKSPTNPSWLVKIAQLHTRNKSYEHACEIYKQLLDLPVNTTKIHFELARLYMAQNNQLESFYHLHQSNVPCTHPNKLISETSSVAGKTILVGGEWLHEDMIQFLPYVQHLKNMGAFVIVQTPRALKTLLEKCNFIDRIITMEQNEPCFFDGYIPITSLPYLFKDEIVEHHTPYIFADETLYKKWHKELGTSTNKKIGIYLKNSAVQLETIISAVPDDANLYLLHCDNYDFLQNLPSTRKIICFGKGFDESSESLINLAGILKHMDLVITSNCTIAHISGALGCTTLVLLDELTLNWRWQHYHGCSIWYPTLYVVENLSALSASCTTLLISQE